MGGNLRNKHINYLHLPLRVERALIRNNIVFIGDLLDERELISSFHNIGENATRHIQETLEFIDIHYQNGFINWKKFWEYKGIQLIPELINENITIKEILQKLPGIIQEILLREFNNDEKYWIVIQRRFQLDPSDKLTLQELGDGFGITKERVRQLFDKALDKLYKAFIENRFDGSDYRVAPEIVEPIMMICQFILSDIVEPIMESDLLDLIGDLFTESAIDYKEPLLFLFQLCGLEPCSFPNSNIIPVWGYFVEKEKSRLIRAIEEINKLLTVEIPRPIRDFDILRHINKQFEGKDTFDLPEIKKIINLCSTVERTITNLVQGKIQFIKGRGNQAERIFLEEGGQQKLVEVYRKLNQIIVTYGLKKTGYRNFQNQVISDGRFMSIGKSGVWGLKSLENLESRSILELMEEILIKNNKPLTAEQIFKYVNKRRPGTVKENSINMYLQLEDKFSKVKNKWGLSYWQESKETTIWNPMKVAEFAKSFFQNKRSNEVYYRELKTALMEETSFTGRQVQGMLNINPVISTIVENGNTRIAIFNKNYEEEIKKFGARIRSKKKTLRDKVSDRVMVILEAVPGNQIKYSELIEILFKEFKRVRNTFYQYVSKLDFIEKFIAPDTNFTSIRLNSINPNFLFDQIEEIVDENLRRKTKRSIKKFTLDEIDIGLFLLSKEFESIVKTFLEKALNKGMLNRVDMLGRDSTRWKLNNMVDCAYINGYITEKGLYHFLRQERNNRSHGTMPSEEERRLLLNSAQLLGGMYIDSIIFFEDLTINL